MATSLSQLMDGARSKVPEVSVADVKRSLGRKEVALVLDVREPEEWSKGHIPHAVNVPRGWLELRADPASPIADPTLCADPAASIVAYCFQAPGVRSLLAAGTLIEMGYTNVTALSGGLRAWIDAGLPVEEPTRGDG